MNDFSTKSRQEPEISATAPDSDAPLWLLQKDDTRFLYVSLFLSVTVHIILFAVMAATNIFHPFTGTTQEFDLVWFSPAGMTFPLKPTTNNSTDVKMLPNKIARNTPTPRPNPAVISQVKSESAPPPPVKMPSPPANSQPQTSPPPAEVQLLKEAPIEEPAEMTISRFSGKVVEVVDKKAENPAFNVISSAKMKSKNARTVAKSIRETEVEPKKPRKDRLKSNQSEDNVAAAQPKKELPGKQIEKVAKVTASANQSKVSQSTVQKNAIQRKVSSAAVVTSGNQTVTLPAVNRSINSFAAALDTLSAAGNKQTAQAQAPQKQLNGLTGSAQSSSLKSPAVPKTPARPPAVEKPAPPEEKLAPQPAAPPQLVLHPPVAGDLKLIITGDIDLKVEVSFKAFPKTRRSKPFTRWEAEKHRNIIPKLIRTRENVHEAVVEVTEEGIYSIMVRVNNGKPGTAGLTLKIRESSPGAKSKNLGSRKIDDLVEVAKVLMPEGVLWNDDSYFTGDMEDADSITKFNSGTGLMWREYK
jgi:hypothetical protein